MSRFVPVVLRASVVVALAVASVGFGATPSALAFAGCATDEALPAAPSYVETATGTAAFFAMPGLCLTTAPTVNVTVNADSLGVGVDYSGTSTAGITLTPASGFSGVSTVEVTLTGIDVRTYTLFAYFGVSSTVTWATPPTQISLPTGATRSFTLTGQYWPDGSACSVDVDQTNGVTLVIDAPNRTDTPVSFHLTSSYKGVFVLYYKVTCTPLGRAASSHTYAFRLYAGVKVPTKIYWPANPPAVAIDELGTGHFSLKGAYVPQGSECEIKVRNTPASVDLAVVPPGLSGYDVNDITVQVVSAYKGPLTVHYDLSCTLASGKKTGAKYTFLLYVGVSLPETGSEPAPVLGLAGGFALLGAAMIVVARRRVRRS